MTINYIRSAVVATLSEIGGYFTRLAERFRIALGLLHGEIKGAVIAQALRQATPEQQTAFAREIGPEALWDVLVTAL
jgi:hypothetical protein